MLKPSFVENLKMLLSDIIQSTTVPNFNIIHVIRNSVLHSIVIKK